MKIHGLRRSKRNLAILLPILGLSIAGLAWDRADGQQVQPAPPMECQDSEIWVLAGASIQGTRGMAWATWSEWANGAHFDFETLGNRYSLYINVEGSPGSVEAIEFRWTEDELVLNDRIEMKRQYGGCVFQVQLEPGLFLLFGEVDVMYENKVINALPHATGGRSAGKWY